MPQLLCIYSIDIIWRLSIAKHTFKFMDTIQPARKPTWSLCNLESISSVSFHNPELRITFCFAWSIIILRWIPPRDKWGCYHTGVYYPRVRISSTEQKGIGNIPDSKVHGANMGPIWGRHDPGGPYVGPMNFAIRDNFRGVFNVWSCIITRQMRVQT